MKYEIDMKLPSLNDYIYAFTDTFEYGKETLKLCKRICRYI